MCVVVIHSKRRHRGGSRIRERLRRNGRTWRWNEDGARWAVGSTTVCVGVCMCVSRRIRQQQGRELLMKEDVHWRISG